MPTNYNKDTNTKQQHQMKIMLPAYMALCWARSQGTALKDKTSQEL